MLLGLFDNSTWNDGTGLSKGEVVSIPHQPPNDPIVFIVVQDVLNINNGDWSRIIPSPDPDNGVPLAREGAAAFSSSSILFGSNGTSGSDVVVFGGLDASGNYLSDMWILRSYSASLSQTNATWSGFGDGTLSSGIDATGSGVTIQYITSCATQLSSPTSSSGSTPGSTSSPSTPNTESATSAFNTDVGHKVLSTVSLIAFMAAVLVHSLSTTSPLSQAASFRHYVVLGSAGAILVAAYALCIAGLVSGFTTISSTSSLTKRSSDSSLFLKTAHGRAALAFVVVLYGLLPLIFALSLLRKNGITPNAEPGEPEPVQQEERQRKGSNDTGFTALMTPTREKAVNHRVTVSTPDIALEDVATPSTMLRTRRRVMSLFAGGHKASPQSDRLSTDDTTRESLSSSGPRRSFEVLNRANRTRRLSGSALNAYSSEGGHSTQGHPPPIPRSLSDLNWLDRRQNVAAFVSHASLSGRS